MAAGDVYQIGAVQVIDTVAMENVFYMKVIDDDGVSEKVTNAAAAFNSNVRSAMKAVQSNELNHECTLIRKVYPTTDIAEVVLVDEDGGQLYPSLPQNVAFILSLYAGDGDKNKRGRAFIPGLPEVKVKEGRIDAGLVSLFGDLEDSFTSDISEAGASYRMQVFSRKLNIHTNVASAVVRPIPTKVRRRTPGMCSLG